MKLILQLPLFLVLLLETSCTKQLENGGKNWALLIAGSNGFFNYRHQADICHAYHVLRDHGVPEENIVVMMYDDIAYSSENPDKGVIINRPGGKNVYPGVKIDYRQEDVSPEVFLNVLQGKQEEVEGIGSGRVINSGPNDNVFVNFVDHGAPGLVGMPNNKILKARDLMAAILNMHKENKFSQMLFYLESCESGSMFKGLLPDDINVYATTAANPKESSYACYYDSHLETYLGDLYSVNWMENSDVANLNAETLHKQFELVKAKTNLSHVQEYGYMSIGKEPVANFLGSKAKDSIVEYPTVPFDAVSVDDVDLFILNQKIDKASEDKKPELSAQLHHTLLQRNKISREMKHIVSMALNHSHPIVTEAMTQRTEAINFDCYEPAVDSYMIACRNLGNEPFAMRMLYALQNLCNVQEMTAQTVLSAISKVCRRE